MAHYAYVDDRNIVTQVVVGKNEDDPLPEGVASWEEYYGALRCSYNTMGGKHRYGGTPLRKNFPGVGYTWDPIRDAFIPPKPYASWTLNEDSCLWEAPVPMPEDGQIYRWDEDSGAWIVIGKPAA